MSLLEWLEDFVTRLEDSENPFTYDTYQSGFNAGCHQSQRKIAEKLRYALEIEKSKNQEDFGELTEELL